MREAHAVRPMECCSSAGGKFCSEEGDLAGELVQQGGVEVVLEEQLEQEEGDSGKGVCRKVISPMEPSPQDKEEHDLTHLPFRNWCRHCCR
jgi:hypothetical protein